MPARLSIRPTTYRNRPGFGISGQGPRGHRISIFAETRESAERIRDKVKAGQEIQLADFGPMNTNEGVQL